MSNLAHNQPERQVLIVKAPKNVGVAIILTFFFGPLGLLYSSVIGGLVMLPVTIIVGFLTVGLGLFITHPICIIWAAVSASTYNKKLLAGVA
jgi:hypothetical protein